tara:strand:+ start:1094 stop:1393 length:300 start_codon:yes stop_codon:yes gene_type:complete
MNKALENNLSVEEFFHYIELPENLSAKLDELLDNLQEQQKEIKYLEKQCELLSEQTGFAVDLLESIDHLVDSLPSKKTGVIPEFQKAYAIVCENSYFER